MESVVELLKSIASENDTCTASKKDEVRVMRAMMNDTKYKVGVYGNEGKKDEFNPSTVMREVCASVISGAAKIPANEANALLKDYEFKRADAERMVEFSKECVNTYLHTGRKLPLGGRKASNISLALKDVPAGERTYPKVVDIDKDGNKIYAPGKTYVPAYESVRVFAPAPVWKKK